MAFNPKLVGYLYYVHTPCILMIIRCKFSTSNLIMIRVIHQTKTYFSFFLTLFEMSPPSVNIYHLSSWPYANVLPLITAEALASCEQRSHFNIITAKPVSLCSKTWRNFRTVKMLLSFIRSEKGIWCSRQENCTYVEMLYR